MNQPDNFNFLLINFNPRTEGVITEASNAHLLGILGKKFVNGFNVIQKNGLFKGSIEDFIDYFRQFDVTSKGNAVLYFLSWFKNLSDLFVDLDEDAEGLYLEFIELLENYGKKFSELLQNKKPILSSDFIDLTDDDGNKKEIQVQNIDSLEDLYIYLHKIDKEYQEFSKRKKVKEDLRQLNIDNVKIKNHNVRLYKATEKEHNVCLGKGSKWCVSGEVTYNTTDFYKMHDTTNFYYALTDIQKPFKDRFGKVFPKAQLKYAYVPLSIPYALYFGMALFLYDYRDSADVFPKRGDDENFPLADEIFTYLNRKVGLKTIISYYNTFIQQITNNNLPELTLPEELVQAHHVNAAPGVHHIPSNRLALSIGVYVDKILNDSKSKLFRDVEQSAMALIENEVGMEGYNNYKGFEDEFIRDVAKPALEQVLLPNTLIKNEVRFTGETNAAARIAITITYLAHKKYRGNTDIRYHFDLNYNRIKYAELEGDTIIVKDNAKQVITKLEI